MRAEIISIGTELLLGDIDDTNATAIARALRDIGLDLLYRTTVGDNEQRIAEVIEQAMERADVIITTGGLGPTVDDVTREAIARATSRPLIFHQTLLDQIGERFQRLGVRMTDNNRRQAYAPDGALLIENPVGTAPIFILKTERGAIMTLPGVPREMRYLLDSALLPWLKDHMGPPACIQSLILRTAGIGESHIDARIGDLMTLSNPTVGLAAHSGQTDIRITAKAATAADATALIDPIEQDIRTRIGEWIYGTGTDTLEEIVLRTLARRQGSLSAAESGTDGLLEKRLALAGNSLDQTAPIVEAINISDASLKTTVEALAQSLRQKHKTTHGAVAAARPAYGEQPGIEVVVAAADAYRVVSRDFTWTAARTDGATWVTTHCLTLLWQLLSQPQQPA